MKNQVTTSLENIKYLLNAILKIPIIWIVIDGIVIILSMFKVEHLTPDQAAIAYNLKIDFQITNITVALLIILWIPSIIKILALLGGGIKFSKAEVTAVGLIKTFTDLIAVVDSVEPSLDPSQQIRIKSVKDEAERELANTMVQDIRQARDNMIGLAEEYERLRATLPSSPQRTNLQGNIFARMRALSMNTNYAEVEINMFLESESIGKRMIGLAALEIRLYIKSFDRVIKIIEISKAPFEQYQAIRVLEMMLKLLNKDQEKEVIRVLEYQRSGALGTIILDKDQSRWNRTAKILEYLKNKGIN